MCNILTQSFHDKIKFVIWDLSVIVRCRRSHLINFRLGHLLAIKAILKQQCTAKFCYHLFLCCFRCAQFYFLTKHNKRIKLKMKSLSSSFIRVRVCSDRVRHVNYKKGFIWPSGYITNLFLQNRPIALIIYWENSWGVVKLVTLIKWILKEYFFLFFDRHVTLKCHCVQKILYPNET